MSYYRRAREEGATVVTGGGVPEMPDALAGGYWVQPTIWTGLAEDSPVVTEEIFGPCCHVAPFDREEEAIERANASPYGLATTNWTQDLARAHRVTAANAVGLAGVQSRFRRVLRTAFGGSRQRGSVTESGRHAERLYTELRTVVLQQS